MKHLCYAYRPLENNEAQEKTRKGSPEREHTELEDFEWDQSSKEISIERYKVCRYSKYDDLGIFLRCICFDSD